MSFQIDVAFVQQFKSNILMLNQQKGSRVRPYIRVKEDLTGKYTHFERLGPTAVVKRTTRHGDTPLVSSDHSRRRCGLSDYEWADLIDKVDEVRMLINPKSEYANNASFAMGRQMDTDIFNAAVGNAVSMNASDTASNVSLPAGQKVAVDFGGANIGITLAKVRRGKKILDANEAALDNRILCINAQMLEEMLGITEVASSDYNSVKALVQGELDTFLGFYWLRTELIPWVNEGSDIKGAIVIQGDGMGLATAKDLVVRIDERSDKAYSTQVFVCMTFGATRINDDNVVEIACDMSP
jgi:hypothetical protein